MKYFFTFLTLGFIFQSFSQITWSTPITVYTGSGSNLHPRVSLNRNGSPLILWGQIDSKAKFSRWNGASFTMPANLNGTTNVFAQTWAGPDLASFGDTVYATYKISPEMTTTNNTYLIHSYDGGVTFAPAVKIDNIGSNISRFPIVGTTSNGNPIVAFMKFDPGTMVNARYVVATSNDYGNTFSTDVQASSSPGSEVCNCCPATVLSSGTKAVMLYRNNLSDIRDIWAGISTDGGSTFTNHMAVDTTGWYVTSCGSSGPDGIIIGDTLYSTFMSNATGTSLAYFGRSSLTNMTASNKLLTGTFAGLSSQNYPRIANAGNAATAVWKQNTSSGNFLAYSFASNVSNGFSGYSTIPAATGSGMMNADVVMAPGSIHIVWQDDNTNKVMYIKGTYTTATDIKSIREREFIEIYPNPANESINVTLKNTNKIMAAYLTDNLGRRTDLKASIDGTNASFNLNGVSKGIYYFTLTDNDGNNYYNKLIVQ